MSSETDPRRVARSHTLCPHHSASFHVFALVRLWHFPYRWKMKTTSTPRTRHQTMMMRMKMRTSWKHWMGKKKKEGRCEFVCQEARKDCRHTPEKQKNRTKICQNSFFSQLPCCLHFFFFWPCDITCACSVFGHFLFKLCFFPIVQFSAGLKDLNLSVHSSLLRFPSVSDGLYQSCVYCNVR